MLSFLVVVKANICVLDSEQFHPREFHNSPRGITSTCSGFSTDPYKLESLDVREIIADKIDEMCQAERTAAPQREADDTLVLSKEL